MLGEHLVCIQEVVGSIPSGSTLVYGGSMVAGHFGDVAQQVEHRALDAKVVGSRPTVSIDDSVFYAVKCR